VKSAPLVSVVIAVYNGERFVADAVASVRQQQYQPIEVIVVDDASTDATVDIAASLPIDLLIVLPDNQGPSAARNIGMARAQGRYITFLDVDDLMLPGRVQIQTDYLARNADCSCVLTHQVLEVLPGITPPAWIHHHPETLDCPPYLPVSSMVSINALLEAGGFDPSYRLSEDMEWLFRLERSGANVTKLDEVLVRRRIHGANATYQTQQMNADLMRAVRALTSRSHLPLVSVIVPVYNGARYLAEALESIRAQTVDHLVQVVVVDDGSTDASASIAESFGSSVQVARQPHAGVGAARNHGVLLARARYLAFLDADDVWLPGKLAAQLAVLETNPEVDAVLGQAEEFVSPELGAGVATALRARPAMPGHLTSAMLTRRSSFARVGPFSIRRGAADWLDWYARAVHQRLRFQVLDDLVVRRRLHAANYSLRHQTARTGYAEILKGAIDRQRGGTA